LIGPLFAIKMAEFRLIGPLFAIKMAGGKCPNQPEFTLIATFCRLILKSL